MSNKKRLEDLETEMSEVMFEIDRVLGYCAQLSVRNGVLEDRQTQLTGLIVEQGKQIYDMITPPDPFLTRVRRWINGDDE